MKIKPLIFLFSIMPLFVYGNGGGTYVISSAMRSSDPILRRIKDINLLSEKLQINLSSDCSEVILKYVLWNSSDKDYTDIDYAFPLDYLSGNTPGNNYVIPQPEISNIYFSFNGKALDFASSESTAIPSPTEAEFENSTFINDSAMKELLCRRWYYTRFSIAKYSLVNLEVRYTLRNLQLSDGSSPLNLDYFDFPSQQQLIYDFSPAASWGDGIIRDFYVEVNSRDLFFSGKKKGVITKGLDFQEEGNKLVYRMRNFNLNKAQPLYICYDGEEISSLECLRQHMISPKEYSSRASQELKNYPTTNLSDMNFETAWVCKSVGDWIEFSFDEATANQLAGFCFVNGHQKSAQTYEQNSRVKTLKIEFKNTDNSTNRTEEDGYSEVITLEVRPYEPLYFENLITHAYYHDFFEASYPIKTVRLTIEEVYPGTKYNDICISEIIFLKTGRLSGTSSLY